MDLYNYQGRENMSVKGESLALQRGAAEGCDDDHVLSAEEAKIKDGQ